MKLIYNELGFVKCDLVKAYFKSVDEIRSDKLKDLGI